MFTPNQPIKLKVLGLDEGASNNGATVEAPKIKEIQEEKPVMGANTIETKYIKKQNQKWSKLSKILFYEMVMKFEIKI